MKKEGLDLVLKLKSALIDYVLRIEGPPQLDQMLQHLIEELQQLMGAAEVTMYSDSVWQKQMFIGASTNKERKRELQDSAIPLSDGEKLTVGRVYRRPFALAELNAYHLVIVLGRNHNLEGLLCIKEKEQAFSDYPEQVLNELSLLCSLYIQKARSYINNITKEKRCKQLYRITEKFHSSMNKESVLEEIILTLKDVYPTFTYFLFLSQDHKAYEGLPIKYLDYNSMEHALMQSYVTGTVVFENSVHERKSILYAPLKGKQGVYGVLEVMAFDTAVFPKNEVEFIVLLATTAGGAIENAHLFQQSRQLIADLQLINETTRYLNTNLRLIDTMEYMVQKVVQSFYAQETAFILFFHGENNPMVQQGSTSFFFSEEAQVYIHYFQEKITDQQESLFIGDLALPHFPEQPDMFHSAMAVPMIYSGALKGFALALHREPYFFSFETFKLYVSLIQHSTLAFSNTILREELEKMVVTDYLTKLYSRNYLDDKIKSSMKQDGSGAFIIIDIDNFKMINDTYGHQVGDEVIIQVANIINANIRETDIGARWGGEELAVYLPEVSVEIGKKIAERLVKRVRETSEPIITVSCGVSYWEKSRSDDSYLRLFKRADKALYKAKTTGKDKVVVQLLDGE
nr:sensor domain-containing diguanylate cyclase [uncultured Bacillus sp.]